MLLMAWVSGRGFAGERNFYNVLAPGGADPWVLRHTDGDYYFTATTGSDLRLWRSRSLVGIVAGEMKIVRTAGGPGPSSQQFWAPELHFLDGKWYLYFAASNGDNAQHRMFVLENSAADPFEGDFVEKGRLFDPQADTWAIDGTVGEVEGTRYFFWSGWEGTSNVRQNLYIARMDNPWTLQSPRVELSRPTYAWETREDPDVNEAPQVLIRGRKIHVVYSASGSWTDHYCLGLLTARLDADLCDSRSWTKHAEPVFRSGNNVFGPGHCSFTKSPNGREDWIVFHAARASGTGWERNIRAQPFGWNTDQTPLFGVPVGPATLLPLPGGEVEHQRYQAETARLWGTSRLARVGSTVKVGHIDTPDSGVEFAVRANRAGPHILSVRFANGTDRGAVATHRVRVNQATEYTLRYPNGGWDRASNSLITIELKRGLNSVALQKGEGFAELDSIDVWPVSLRPRPLVTTE